MMASSRLKILALDGDNRCVNSPLASEKFPRGCSNSCYFVARKVSPLTFAAF